MTVLLYTFQTTDNRLIKPIVTSGKSGIKIVKSMNRREFLKLLSLSISAAALNQTITGCTNSAPPANQQLPAIEPTRPATQSNLGQRTPTLSTDTPSQLQSPSGSPDLVVARNGQPEELVRRAISALGGAQRFITQGAKVVIKPNICVAYHTYEYAATTNPWVVGALVKLCFEAGAKQVQVFDFPFGGTIDEAYTKSGIAEQVKLAGGEMVGMPRFKFVRTELPSGQDLREANIFDDVLKADVLIDVPIAKHHSLARLTMGMKNLMGVIADRPSIHRNMGQRLADLTSKVKPALTVIDAIRILVDNGPTGGNLADVKQLDTIIASPDIVAADSYGTTLFGLRPDDLSYIKAASAMGLGNSDLNAMRIEEINIGA
jgi:uncharacterized protein (DUF362 family)